MNEFFSSRLNYQIQQLREYKLLTIMVLMDFKVEYINKLKIVLTTLLIVLLSVFAYIFQNIFDYLENISIDIRSNLTTDVGLFSQRYKPADKNIVIISINELTQYEAARSSELRLTRWPWSREVWAKLINFIEKQNPRVLVVDLNFSNYEDLSRNYASSDMVLADALGYHNNIILATALRTPHSQTENYNASKILDNFENPYTPSSDPLNLYIDNEEIDKNISFYSHTPIPNIFTNSTTMGVTNLVTNPVNKEENIRYSQPIYKLIKGNKEYYIPSIGLAALLKYEGIGKLAEEIPLENNLIKIGKHRIRVNEKGQTLINWHKRGNVYQDIPVNSILLSMVRGTNYFEHDNQKYPLNFFKDKIVIIAQTQTGMETHNSPIAKEMPDAQIKATIIDNYINDSDITNTHKKMFLKHITPYKGILITVAFCIMMITAMLVATNMPLAFTNGVLLLISYILIAIFLFAHPKFRIIIDMALPLYAIGSTFIIAFVLKAHHEFKKKKKIEKIFGNLVSEKVLKQLVNKPHRLNLKSTVQKVTVMSCNINNNLQISEALTPEKYVDLINNVFNTIEKIIFKYNGTINRFVGNTVLVYWGYPIHSRKDSENAIRAAIEIQQKIDEINSSFGDIKFEDYDEQNFGETNPGSYNVNVRIAINTGNTLVGQIGSSNLSDFTVMGGTVEVVEKIENICTEFNKNILVTENTLNQLDEEIPAEYAGQIKLKNSNEKIKIFEIKYFI